MILLGCAALSKRVGHHMVYLLTAAMQLLLKHSVARTQHIFGGSCTASCQCPYAHAINPYLIN